jgi:hypothetical protein
MRTLLRNARTGAYFQGLADWTHNPREAFDFKMPERAIRFVRDACLDKVEVVFAFDDPRYNIPVPVDERFGFKNGSESKGRRATVTC